jgi:dihydrofolate reductase
LVYNSKIMRVSAIVAATDNDVISKNGIIPWKMPADAQFLRRTINGRPIILGSGTYKFMRKAYGKGLNIVVTNTMKPEDAPDAVIVHSLEEALRRDELKDFDEIFIFGGQGIYEAAMPNTQRIYLTRIHTNIDGDKFFKYNPQVWQEVSREEHKKDEKNPYDYDFIVLERRSKI